jgi:hypothetical protein
MKEMAVASVAEIAIKIKTNGGRNQKKGGN